MKTKKLFLTLLLTIFTELFSVYCQNVVYSTTQSLPGNENVLVGTNCGTNITTTPILGQQNVFVGNSSGSATTNGSQNTFIGHRSGLNNTTGGSNVYIGNGAGINYATTSGNTFVGSNSGVGSGTVSNNTGGFNVFFGSFSGNSNSSGNRNSFVGASSGSLNTTGIYNAFFGVESGLNCTTGMYNTFIGPGSGSGITTGNFNTILGRTVGLSSTLSNTTIISDGNNGQRIYIHSNGNTGIGLGNYIIPKNRLDVNGGVAIGLNYGAGNGTSPNPIGSVAPTNGMLVEGRVGIGNTAPNNKVEITEQPVDALGRSGLRFTNLTNGNTTSANPLKKVLSVNSTGDVILVDDNGSNGLIQNCSTAGFLPINSTTPNTLACSQIFDNGVGVGVGYTTIPTDPTFFDYNYNSTLYTNYTGGYSYGTGAIKFHVNGNARANGIWTTSDKKFKKDIKPIKNALETIQKIEGKTYLWNKESFKDKNFDGGGHSGFIAQELEKVLPHLVATGENGEKAVNYMELMPYLVEAIKEQQTQINDLKNQLAENFKAQNQDLIELTNTKIINVSPNPSNDMITVSFNIEKSVQSAKLQVHDLNGTIISNLTINDRDNNITRTLQKDNFGKGIYVVSLVINGKSIDTKKIVFN